jgi:thiamine pyrophosphate-dependent acetolactate synthase large subunit-like protein
VLLPESTVHLPDPNSVERLAAILNRSRSVTLFAGSGVRDARPQVLALATTLHAPIGHSLGGKEWIQHDNPFDVGMSGLLGYGRVLRRHPHAIGAHFAAPDRQVVCMSGDGGLAMLMGELLTVGRHNLPLRPVPSTAHHREPGTRVRSRRHPYRARGGVGKLVDLARSNVRNISRP